MEQPPRYVAQGESSKVCFLRQAIYRFKQSPCACFSKYSCLLSTFGFTSRTTYPTMITKKTKGGSLFLLSMWMIFFGLVVMTLVFMLPRLIYRSNLVFMTWVVPNTF